MAIATMTESCPGVEQSSIQGGKLPSSSHSIKSGAMHLAPAPDVKELSNFLLLERSGIQVCLLCAQSARPPPSLLDLIASFPDHEDADKITAVATPTTSAHYHPETLDVTA